MTKTALATAALVLALAAPAWASSVYSGQSSTGARVTLVRDTSRTNGNRARITLGAATARRVTGKAVRLQCGKGDYGSGDVLGIIWPKGFTSVKLPAGPVPAGVDRCRLRRATTTFATMRMHRA